MENAAPNLWEAVQVDQFTRWQEHHREIATFCGIAVILRREAAEMISEYKRLFAEEQRYGFAQNEEAERDRISQAKRRLIGFLQENARIQARNLQGLRLLLRRQEEFANDLDTLQAIMSQVEDLEANPDQESILDVIFGIGTLTPAEVPNEPENDAPQQPAEQQQCPICMEEFEFGITPRPLCEGTEVALTGCCNQALHRECLELYWDADNDNKIGCPLCRGDLWS